MQHLAAIHDISYAAELRQFDIDSRPFRRAAARGNVVRIHRGAYIPTAVWNSLSRDEQYRHQVIAATGASRTHPILSHQSAAAVWGIPLIGATPRLVHVLASESAGTRTEGSFRRHASRFLASDIEEVDGIGVTSLRRTIIDLAHTLPFPAAVAAVDWGLRVGTDRDPKPHTTIEELFAGVDELGMARGHRRVYRALEFGDCLSGSAGESVSRAVIHELGFPPPVLQKRFDDRFGLIGFTDFWWPEFQHIGEFDGLFKYTRDQYRNGRTIDEIVLDEKKREDRLRALGPSISRWLWTDAMNSRLLFDVLREAGLPSSRRSA